MFLLHPPGVDPQIASQLSNDCQFTSLASIGDMGADQVGPLGGDKGTKHQVLFVSPSHWEG